MIWDFAAADRVTLKSDGATAHATVDARLFQLGPLVELLIFRRRSLRPGADLKLLGSGSLLSAALGSMPDDTGWAYHARETVGALRVRPGRPSDDDDIVQQQFLMDILKRLTGNGLSKASAQALTGAAGELIDNIGQHAGLGCHALAAYDIGPDSLWLAIGDSGVGALQPYGSMPEILTAAQALEAAVVQHRSSTGDLRRGLGFRKVLAALRSMDASLRVRSGNASLETEGIAGSGSWMLREQTQLQGFVVSVHVRW